LGGGLDKGERFRQEAAKLQSVQIKALKVDAQAAFEI